MGGNWRQIKENGERNVVSGRGVEPGTHGLRVRNGRVNSAVPPLFTGSATSVFPVLSPLPGPSFADHLSAVVRLFRLSRPPLPRPRCRLKGTVLPPHGS